MPVSVRNDDLEHHADVALALIRDNLSVDFVATSSGNFTVRINRMHCAAAEVHRIHLLRH